MALVATECHEEALGSNQQPESGWVSQDQDAFLSQRPVLLLSELAKSEPKLQLRAMSGAMAPL